MVEEAAERWLDRFEAEPDPSAFRLQSRRGDGRPVGVGACWRSSRRKEESMSELPNRGSSGATVCGQRLDRPMHLCAFFDSEHEEYDCLVPFFAEGLDQGEQVITIRDSNHCAEHLAKLRELMPCPTDAPIRENQLRLVASEETYLQDGTFEAERMYSLLRAMLRNAAGSGFKRVRACGDMTWALRNMPGTDELIEYECNVNKLVLAHECTLMCLYDVNKFSGRAVMDVLATHPLVVMGKRVYENPYYVRPDVFLEKLLRRGPSPLAREDAVAV
jgi:hypothetical protein